MHTYTETLKDRTQKCCNCGKKFEVPYYCVEWGYWYAGSVCCGYSCMMAMRRKDQEKLAKPIEKSSSKAPMTKEEIKKIERMIYKGYSNEKASQKSGRSRSTIQNIR